MSRFLRAVVLLVIYGFALSSASADDMEETLGGFICVRPFSPSCAARAETYQSFEKIEACRSEVDRFVAATVAYRDCLEGKISDAIRAANDVLNHFHCLSRDRECPASARRQ